MALVYLNGFEDQATSFIQQGTWFTNGFSSGTVRTGATAFALCSANSDSVTTRTWLPIPGGGDATVIVGMGQLFTNATGTYMLGAFWSDNGTTTHVTVMYSLPSGVLTVYRGNNTGTVLGTVTLSGPAILPNAWGYWEIKCVLSDTVGEVHVRYNGTAVIDLTGVDTKNAGTKTIIDTVQLPMGWVNGPTVGFDDMYIVTGTGAPNNFLGDCRVYTLYPNGDGDFSQMIGSDGDSVSNFALVNEAGAPNTSNYVESSTAGQRDFYNMQDLAGLAPNATILGVQVTGWCSNADAGSGRSAILGVRQGVSEALSSAQALTAATFLAVRGVFTTDPGTGTAWNQASVNSAQAGIQVN